MLSLLASFIAKSLPLNSHKPARFMRIVTYLYIIVGIYVVITVGKYWSEPGMDTFVFTLVRDWGYKSRDHGTFFLDYFFFLLGITFNSLALGVVFAWISGIVNKMLKVKPNKDIVYMKAKSIEDVRNSIKPRFTYELIREGLYLSDIPVLDSMIREREKVEASIRTTRIEAPLSYSQPEIKPVIIETLPSYLNSLPAEYSEMSNKLMSHLNSVLKYYNNTGTDINNLNGILIAQAYRLLAPMNIPGPIISKIIGLIPTWSTQIRATIETQKVMDKMNGYVAFLKEYSEKGKEML